MYAVTYSAVLSGMEAIDVQVEVNLSKGIPSFNIVGLPDSAVKESRDRVQSAIFNSGYEFPVKKVTINLAPADIKKEGSYFDLPIAVAILIAGMKLKNNLERVAIIGELALDGSCRAVNGILPMIVGLKKTNIAKFILPSGNTEEALLVKGADIYPVDNLSQAIKVIMNGFKKVNKLSAGNKEKSTTSYSVDFSEVRGQLYARRALEIASAGSHNLIFVGPPGVGKTMLARRFKTILPDMTEEEALETSMIYSAAGLLKKGKPLINNRPFRAPHHSISDIAIVGGGSKPRPGEVSLAHNGVLFLDEFPEFTRKTLESLRQPLEEGFVSISRVRGNYTFPARFILIAAMNPCPCGYRGDRKSICRCNTGEIRRYQKKISGPLLDRIDLHIEVPSLTFDEIVSSKFSESSAEIRERVQKAISIQRLRYAEEEGIFTNAHLSDKLIKKYCEVDDKALMFLKDAYDKLSYSVRSFKRIFKIARTIADLDSSFQINTTHIAEAISYRYLDRDFIL